MLLISGTITHPCFGKFTINNKVEGGLDEQVPEKRQ